MTDKHSDNRPLEVLWPENIFGRVYCSSRHPTEPAVYCRRQKQHDGDHAAFVFSIKIPESWPA